MKKYTILTLVFLVLFAFLLRFSIFKRPHDLTFDGFVYARLATQISEDPLNYNTIEIYENMTKKGWEILTYFKKPLFKHPPLFPFLISMSYKIFGRTYNSAFLVSLFFGILLIALAYLFGSLLFNDKIGVYAAILMSIEPINWICSQKIWMETTLAFFGVLSLYLFARVIKKYNPYLMILSGVSAGLAMLTKYPGVLFVAIIFVYALCCERWIFKKKIFILSLFIPFIMFTPWFYWNYKIYGIKFITDICSMHNVTYHLNWIRQKYLFITGFFLLIIVLFFFLKKSRKFRSVFIPALVFTLLFILGKNIMNSFDFNYIPSTSWIMGMFSKEPWHFYLGRLLELSPFYIFSFFGLFLFLFDKHHIKEYFFLFLWFFIILAFYIAWRNFQCRYILSLVIPLVVLSAKTQLYILEKIKGLPAGFIRTLVGFSYALIILFVLLKTLHVNIILAIPNLACYF